MSASIPDYSAWTETYRIPAGKEPNEAVALRSVACEIGKANAFPIVARVHTWGDNTHSVSITTVNFRGDAVTDTLFRKPGAPDNADIRATVTQWLDDWNAPAPTGFQSVIEGAKSFFGEFREAVQKRKAETVAHAQDLTAGKESGGGVAEPNTRRDDPPAGVDSLTPEQPGRVHVVPGAHRSGGARPPARENY